MKLSTEIEALKDQIEMKLQFFNWMFLESQNILSNRIELTTTGFKVMFEYLQSQKKKNVDKTLLLKKILKFCNLEKYEIQKDYATRYIIIPFSDYNEHDMSF